MLQQAASTNGYFKDFAALLEKKSTYLCDALRSAGLDVVTPQGGYFVVAHSDAIVINDPNDGGCDGDDTGNCDGDGGGGTAGVGDDGSGSVCAGAGDGDGAGAVAGGGGGAGGDASGSRSGSRFRKELEELRSNMGLNSLHAPRPADGGGDGGGDGSNDSDAADDDDAADKDGAAGRNGRYVGFDLVASEHMTKEVGVCCLPTSAFYANNADKRDQDQDFGAGNLLRFCFVKADDELEEAAKRLNAADFTSRTE